MLEAYEAYGDYETMMETVESVVKRIAQNVLGSLVVRHQRRAETEHALKEVRLAFAEATPFFIKSGEPSSAELLPKDRIEAQILATQEAVDLANLSKEEPSAIAMRVHGAIEATLSLLPVDSEKAELPRRRLQSALSTLQPLTVEKVIDLTHWRRARYKDLVCEKAGADWFELTPSERRRRATEDLKLSGDIANGYEDFEVTGAVFEKLVEPTLIQPTFVTHLPKELVPLAKLSPDDPTTVEVFECCINGQEIAPGYSEQNDPVAQRAALEQQAGGEQQKLDEDFLTALEHGMPPAGGIGIGIDRLCMMLLGQETIRDVILFPQLKPR